MRANKFCAVLLSCLLLLQPLSAWALTYTGSASYRSGKYYTALTAVELTGDPRTDIVHIATSQIGYQEGDNASQLSGEVKGGNNYTEYGRWYGLQDMWCAMFVSWCADTAGVPTTVVPSHSFTVAGLNKFITWGRAYTRAQIAAGVYTPKGGDIIYFKSPRNSNITNHVGIVTSYTGTTVYTVEGNTSSATVSTNGGAVCAKSYDIGNTYIVYICSPNYTGTSAEPVTPGTAYFPACAGSYTSLVDALASVGADSTYANRKRIAAANGIEDYEGKAAQNSLLLEMLKAGTLVDPDGTPPAPQPDENYFPACADSFTSLAPALDSIGVDASLAYRKKIALANDIADYSGTVDQNTQMLNLLKAGKLRKPTQEAVPTVRYYPACSASCATIAAELSSIGADSSYTFRKYIAAANNMIGYSGTAEQNTQMLELLKAGKLIVPEDDLTLAPCGCKSTYVEHITVAETCTEDGAEYDRCTHCGSISDRVTTPAAGHSFAVTLTKPTTSAPGAKVYCCTCGESYTESIPMRVPGDVTADGTVNLLDVVVLQRYLAGGWDITLNEYNADVDADDTLTLADAVRIHRSLVGGWNVNLQ